MTGAARSSHLQDGLLRIGHSAVGTISYTQRRGIMSSCEMSLPIPQTPDKREFV